MEGLSELFVEKIAEKDIYKFSSTHLNNNVPHYFICIKRTDTDFVLMTVCTSQFETVRRFVETRKLPNSTLVYIRPNGDPFHKSTYINCNNVFIYTIDDLKDKFEKGQITASGTITDGEYDQILRGIHASPIIEKNVKNAIPPSL